MNCNHTTLESCLRGDECAQCLRDELAEALKRADAEYAHAKSLQETINSLSFANNVADLDAKAMERLIAVLQGENDRLTQEVAALTEPIISGRESLERQHSMP